MYLEEERYCFKKCQSRTQEALDCSTNSPRKYLKKCLEGSMGNMHPDFRV